MSDLFSTEELAARQMDGKVLDPCANIVAANVYLGAEPIARAFDEGAEIVVTGRVADPALALGPLVHAHPLGLEGLAAPRFRHARRPSPRMRRAGYGRIFC